MTAISVQLPSHWTDELLAAALTRLQRRLQCFGGRAASASSPTSARRLTPNIEDAEDVCQESILKAFTKLDQFAETQEAASDDFRNWLTTITVNSAIDCNRRKRAFQIVDLDERSCRHRASYQTSCGMV